MEEGLISAGPGTVGRTRGILCAGIIVLDEVFRVERFPEADTKAAAQSYFMVNGGCAANAAVAVARLGGRAALAGPLGGPAGEDPNGDHVLAALAREGVDCSACPRVAGVPTGEEAQLDARAPTRSRRRGGRRVGQSESSQAEREGRRGCPSTQQGASPQLVIDDVSVLEVRIRHLSFSSSP